MDRVGRACKHRTTCWNRNQIEFLNTTRFVFEFGRFRHSNKSRFSVEKLVDPFAVTKFRDLFAQPLVLFLSRMRTTRCGLHVHNLVTKSSTVSEMAGQFSAAERICTCRLSTKQSKPRREELKKLACGSLGPPGFVGRARCTNGTDVSSAAQFCRNDKDRGLFRAGVNP